jgi:hypothetical protein
VLVNTTGEPLADLEAICLRVPENDLDTLGWPTSEQERAGGFARK